MNRLKGRVIELLERENKNPGWAGETPLSPEEIEEIAEYINFIYLNARVARVVRGDAQMPLYKDRPDLKQDPVSFLRRTWDIYVGNGALFQDQLRKVDPNLLTEMKWYRHKRGEPTAVIPGRSVRVQKINECLRRFGLRAP